MSNSPTSHDNPDSEQPVVLVVDDDLSIRTALGSLFRSVGLRSALFDSAAAFLRSNLPDAPTCLILDVRLQGMSGFDLQAELTKENVRIPIIFMTAYADVPMSVRAMKSGAFDFISKPFRDQDLLEAVHGALERDRKQRVSDKRASGLKARFELLTAREREVMTYVIEGHMNKQIAHELDLSEITVKLHRGNVMRKMAAQSLPDLVRMAEALELRSPKRT